MYPGCHECRIELPSEVWDYILDHLWDNPTALCACSLACRAWIPTTRLHLFRTIKVCLKDSIRDDGREERFAALSIIAPYARTLEVPDLRMACTLLPIFCNVQHLATHGYYKALDGNEKPMVATSNSPKFPTIRTLSIDSVELHPYHLEWISSIFPNVSSLRLNGIIWSLGHVTSGAYEQSTSTFQVSDFSMTSSDNLLVSWLLRAIGISRIIDLQVNVGRLADTDWVYSLISTHDPRPERLKVIFEGWRVCSSDLAIAFPHLDTSHDTRLHSLHLQCYYYHVVRPPRVEDYQLALLFLSKIYSSRLERVEITIHMLSMTPLRYARIDWSKVDMTLLRLARERPHIKMILNFTQFRSGARDTVDTVANLLPALRAQGVSFGIKCVVRRSVSGTIVEMDERWFPQTGGSGVRTVSSLA